MEPMVIVYKNSGSLDWNKCRYSGYSLHEVESILMADDDFVDSEYDIYWNVTGELLATKGPGEPIFYFTGGEPEDEDGDYGD